jgi:hypothetical protein
MERPCDMMADDVALLLACRSGIEGQLFLMFFRLPIGACCGWPLVHTLDSQSDQSSFQLTDTVNENM